MQGLNINWDRSHHDTSSKAHGLGLDVAAATTTITFRSCCDIENDDADAVCAADGVAVGVAMDASVAGALKELNNIIGNASQAGSE